MRHSAQKEAAINIRWLCGNTAVGVVNFGGTAHFVGRVHDDDLGVAFRHDIIAAGVGFDNPPLAVDLQPHRQLFL